MAKVGRPRQHGQARDTAEVLKKSALDLMSQSNGAVTVKEIARDAGVTTAMIYYHFRDKDELLHATIEYAVETALSHFEQVSAEIDHPADVIHEWLRMHVALHPEIGKVLKLILDHRHSDAQAGSLDPLIDRFYSKERAVILDSIARGRDSGVFAQGPDGTVICLMISTFLDGAVMRKRVFADYDIGASVAAFEQMLWRTLGYMGRAK